MKFGIPPEALVRHEAGEQLARHAEGEIQLPGLEPGHARREVPDALDDDRLGRRRPAPVAVERLERHLHAGLLTHELVRAGADRLRLEPVAADLLVVVLGHDPPDAADPTVVEVHEVDERLLEVEHDRPVVQDLDVLELVVKELRVGALIVLVGPLHVRARQRLSVVELEARAQPERRPPEVRGYLGVLGQRIGDISIVHRLDQRVVNQVVVHLHRDGVGVLERIEPARVEREVHRDGQRALRHALRRVHLGRLDVQLRQRAVENGSGSRLLRGRRITYRQEGQDDGESQKRLGRSRSSHVDPPRHSRPIEKARRRPNGPGRVASLWTGCSACQALGRRTN